MHGSAPTAALPSSRKAEPPPLPVAAPPGAQRRPVFPRDPDEQPAAVLDILTATARPLQVSEVVQRFRGARRDMRAEVEDSLVLLAQYGQIALLPDGRYLVRRAA